MQASLTLKCNMGQKCILILSYCFCIIIYRIQCFSVLDYAKCLMWQPQCASFCIRPQTNQYSQSHYTTDEMSKDAHRMYQKITLHTMTLKPHYHVIFQNTFYTKMLFLVYDAISVYHTLLWRHEHNPLHL